jgi:UDP-N-acetylmuramate-alanine ligase
LLKPSVAVITNVEAEHLENYENNEDELWRAFSLFAESARDALILNADDERLCQRLDPDKQEITYGLDNGIVRATRIRIGGGRAAFSLEYFVAGGASAHWHLRSGRAGPPQHFQRTGGNMRRHYTRWRVSQRLQARWRSSGYL